MDYIDSKLNGLYSANYLAKEIEVLKETKQPILVSGTNIRTVNNKSLVGSGNVELTEAVLSDKLITTVTVGGIPAGTIFEAGTSIEGILQSLFKPSSATTLYFGESVNIPQQIEASFNSASIPADFITNGYLAEYTTRIQGKEYGQYCVFSYPLNFGVLQHIYCNGLTQFDLINSWSKKIILVGENSYYLYYQNIETKEINSNYKFLFK